MSEPKLPVPTRIVSAAAILGEGPVWVVRERALYWLDIPGRRNHRFDPASGAATSLPTPFRITAVAPRASGGFVGASRHGFLLNDAALSRLDILVDPEPELPGNRFNDRKVSPAGRF